MWAWGHERCLRSTRASEDSVVLSRSRRIYARRSPRPPQAYDRRRRKATAASKAGLTRAENAGRRLRARACSSGSRQNVGASIIDTLHANTLWQDHASTAARKANQLAIGVHAISMAPDPGPEGHQSGIVAGMDGPFGEFHLLMVGSRYGAGLMPTWRISTAIGHQHKQHSRFRTCPTSSCHPRTDAQDVAHTDGV
jgi:hypothetical protein